MVGFLHRVHVHAPPPSGDYQTRHVASLQQAAGQLVICNLSTARLFLVRAQRLRRRSKFPLIGFDHRGTAVGLKGFSLWVHQHRHTNLGRGEHGGSRIGNGTFVVIFHHQHLG